MSEGSVHVRYDEFDYEPEVTVRQVWIAECGNCGWDTGRSSAAETAAEAERHRAWHAAVVETLEGDPLGGSCCSHCGNNDGPELRRDPHGGRPWLQCSVCGSQRPVTLAARTAETDQGEAAAGAGHGDSPSGRAER